MKRKRLAAPNFEDLAHLEERLQAFIKAWNAEPGPFHGERRSFDEVLARTEAAIQEVA